MPVVEFFTFEWLSWPSVPFLTLFSWTSSTFWIALIFSLTGAYLVSERTKEAGAFNYPVNLVFLFLGASLANWLARDVPLPLDATVQVPAILSMIGMSFAGLTIIWIVKRG